MHMTNIKDVVTTGMSAHIKGQPARRIPKSETRHAERATGSQEHSAERPPLHSPAHGAADTLLSLVERAVSNVLATQTQTQELADEKRRLETCKEYKRSKAEAFQVTESDTSESESERSRSYGQGEWENGPYPPTEPAEERPGEGRGSFKGHENSVIGGANPHVNTPDGVTLTRNTSSSGEVGCIAMS